MNTAEAIVKILEDANIKHIFGHPGEQIIPFYAALEGSNIEHVLMRHEQGAIHAADGYARSSGDFGVCIATAGPGALNFTMGLATAFKDSVPMLVITGDNPTTTSSSDSSHPFDKFQDIDIESIFKPLTFKSFYPKDGKTAIKNIQEATQILKNEPKGPIHINLPKDVLLDENIGNSLENNEINDNNEANDNNELNNNELIHTLDFNYSQLDKAITLIKSAKKPLILAGAGVFWGKAREDFKKFVETNNIPYVYTYHAKSLIKDCKMDLGLVGIRGSKMANYGFNNADLIIVLGSKLSERTITTKGDLSLDKDEFFNSNTDKTKYINVNIDEKSLYGDIKIHGDVGFVLKELNSLNKINNSMEDSFLDEIYSNDEKYIIKGIDSETIPIKPQVAIKIILDRFKNNFIVNDAGSHTTWVNLLSEIYSNEKLIFSGAMAPMGYGLPAACGVSVALAKKDKDYGKTVLINGDGGFQMNIQELATIASMNLPILIIVLNNSQLGVIRQSEETYKKGLRYNVDLENPDFASLANAYGIDSEMVSSKEGLKLAIDNLKLDKPYLIEILVDEEDIPVV